MTAPHLVAAGVLDIGGREVPCAVLSDRRRVLFDVPVEGMLDWLSDHERAALTVHYEGHDGAPLEAFDSGALIDLAGAWIVKAAENRTERNMRIGWGCHELLRALTMIGMRALAAEAVGGSR